MVLIINHLTYTMYHDNGGGLAAIQVGIKKRIFVMDNSDTHNKKIVAINPKIIEMHGEEVDEEGCLSFPGISAKVKRHRWVKMQALDEFGEFFEISADGYLGRCIQHEIDHLNGITYIDHLSPLKRSIIEKKYFKFNKK